MENKLTEREIIDKITNRNKKGKPTERENME